MTHNGTQDHGTSVEFGSAADGRVAVKLQTDSGHHILDLYAVTKIGLHTYDGKAPAVSALLDVLDEALRQHGGHVVYVSYPGQKQAIWGCGSVHDAAEYMVELQRAFQIEEVERCPNCGWCAETEQEES